MKSLFAKTLLWFLGAALIPMIALVISATITHNTSERREPPFGLMVALQLQEARQAYETGGSGALQATLKRFESVTAAEGILTDANGVDLATGEDRADLVKGARARSRLPFVRRNRAAVAKRSADGAYWYFMFLNRGNWVDWFVQPRNHLLILGMLVLLCYAFARHLTKPVEKLKETMDCFGRGDLTARAHSRRGDEIGQLARTFDTMADRIQTLLAAERRLLMDISHELRSPLARLSVAVELARTDGNRDNYLDRIQREADRLNALVGELLEVTRVEGDPSQRKLEIVRLDEIVKQIVEDCRIEADARGCRLELTGGQAVEMPGDPELLRRAVENVIRNAIRYAPEGTAVEVHQGGGSVAVRDYGPGVPGESLERIFDPLYRVESDRGRDSGGVGLGLAIARRAVELHQGRIKASQAHPGLRVEITFPA
ncbi:MAG TPA: ATP-binding protein [Bryobacteraceae bacterium]|nr:ATP-binding protein [Bryobacteraceae bacterium]